MPSSREMNFGGVSFLVPRYVSRIRGGWQVRMTRQPSRAFMDRKSGGIEKAFDLACGVIAQARSRLDGVEVVAPTDRSHGIERLDKQHQTGIPGVMLRVTPPRRHRTAEVSFAIKLPGQPLRVKYIGTADTWESNYQAKAQEVKRELAQRHQGGHQ